MSASFSSAPRTALVTGAGKRLGREIALGLARAGWRVAVHYRSSELEALQTAQECLALNASTQSLDPQHFIFQADLADETATRHLLPMVLKQMGQVDAVVNSAALFEHDDVQSFSYANMAQHWASNTGAAIVLAQALHQHCQQRNSPTKPASSASAVGLAAGLAAPHSDAVVINMLDQKLWNPNPDFLSYTLSKAALEAANTLLAQAIAPFVRVVGVAPGLTLTSHMVDEDKFKQLHKLSPLGRSSSVEDVVSTVVFAMHNRAITGTTLLVDGGQHLMKFERDFSLM